jgi:DNA-binding NarL/FixJ family response regulator
LFSAHADDVVLMITDLGLPKLGGIELIEKIRAKKPSMKIIGSSGYSRANVAEEVLKAGGDAFAPKPYLVADLLRTVRQLLGRS